MKKKPLVSVIIPYFNKIKYFHKTINSVLSQDYKNFEVIIIYDDSNKKDLKKIKSIINHNKKKIKLIINNKNLGAGKSRNKGIVFSSGSYLAFIDSDDIWKKNKLSKQIKFMLDYDYNISFTGYSVIDANSKNIKYVKAEKKITYQDLLKTCNVGLSTVIIKKQKMFNHKFANYKTQEDYSLWLKLSKNEIFYGLNIDLTKWRKLSNSLSSNNIQKISDAFKVYYQKEKFNFFNSIFRIFILIYNKINKNL